MIICKDSKIYLYHLSSETFCSLPPPHMWSMFIVCEKASFWNATPQCDIITSVLYIYCWKKLNYCDFFVAPAPKWFLVISHHFSCSAKVISWKSKCFLLYSSSCYQTMPVDFCLTTNLNLLPCQTLMWSIIFSISCVIVTHFVHHLNLSTYVLNVHLRCAI